MITATYSPEDNKLRLSASSRLDKELYDRVRAAGFRWAPKQDVFVAPMWTPEREDLALELAGEVEDEDTSLVDRAEERAERFEGYGEKRSADASRARAHVDSIADGIPFGQPILVGHHSEKHARRDAEKIRAGMERAVKMWQTSQYWERRAAGAIHHAKYKERPDVRARRIKGLESDQRRNAKYTGERAQRWADHYANRLAYERAMLAADGGTVADRTKPEKGGACRCWASPRGGWSYIQKANKVTVTVLDNWGNGGGNFTRNIPFDKLAAVMSAAEVEEAKASGRLIGDEIGFRLRPEIPASEPDQDVSIRIEPERPEATDDDFRKMQESLRAGVQVVSAPQLFPTPPALAEALADEISLQDTDEVLEPSAGTGAIVDAILARGAKFFAVEVNYALCERLSQKYGDKTAGICKTVLQGDFLEIAPDQLGKFDAVLMNPPFENASDIKHIQHAVRFLKPGGRLAAICANGPRQNAQLAGWARSSGGSFEALPANSFAGTSVSTAMLVYFEAEAPTKNACAECDADLDAQVGGVEDTCADCVDADNEEPMTEAEEFQFVLMGGKR